MKRAASGVLLEYLRNLVAEPAALAVSDRELLRRFAERRDEGAFTLLVRRHGPMVLQVCRRLLQHEQDAEDVCQATFLILASKAAAPFWQPSVASWLHRVAYHLASKAKVAAVRRRIHEHEAAERRACDPLESITGRELLAALDEELHRLPEKYRSPLVLCYLEGATRDQAAAQLACPLGTLKHRVERAREMLRIRLARRGVTLPALLAAGMLADKPGQAALAGGLGERVVHGALAFTSSKTLLAQVVSEHVRGLAERGLKSMALTKLKLAGGLLLAVGVFAGSVTTLAQRGGAGDESLVLSRQPPTQHAELVFARPADAGPVQRTDQYGDPLPAGAVARIGTTRLRTSGSIHVAAFAPDQSRLAFGTGNDHVYVCAADGKLLLDIQTGSAPPRGITELAFSPDSQLLAISGYWFESLWLFDLGKEQIRYTLPNPGENQERWSRVWQGPTFGFTPDGRTLVVAGKDGALHFWDTLTGTAQAVLREDKAVILSLTLSADGQTALTAHDGGALHLWDVARRRHLQKLPVAANYPHFTALAPDGKSVAVARSATEVELWDSHGGLQHRLRTDAALAGLGFTPNAAALRVADGNGTISTWDVRTGQKQSSLSCTGITLRKPNEQFGPEPAAWFRPDGRGMAWSSAGTIRPWDLRTGQESPRLGLYRHGVQWCGFSADGRWLRVAGNDGELGIWDMANSQLQGQPQQLPIPAEARAGPHYIPASDRRSVVAVTWAGEVLPRPFPDDGRIFLWDPARSAAPVPLSGQVISARYAALTPDNRFVVVTHAPDRIQVYDAATGQAVRSFLGRKSEYQVVLSPDGTLLATTAANDTIRLYDFATGQVLRELKGPGRVSCVAFAPAGRTLASGHLAARPPTPLVERFEPRNSICIWETASGQKLRQIPTSHHTAQVLTFSPDGRLVASCGLEPTVHVWEVASGQARRHYEGHRDGVSSVDFAPEGRRLVSGSRDGTALIWQLFDPAPASRSAAELESCWTDLAENAAVAHAALGALLAAKETTTFLHGRLRPVRRPTEAQVKQWLADLAGSVTTRQTAQHEIIRAGNLAAPALRRALASVTDSDVQGRISDLLEFIRRSETPAEQLRDLRAVEVLEYVRSADARRLLKELADGDPGARLTHEAKAALARLSKPIVPSP